MRNKIILLVFLFAFVRCPFWENQLDYLNEKIPSEEELAKILDIDYQPNDISEEFLNHVTTNSPLFFSDENIENTCADRKDYSGPDIFQFFPQTKGIIHNTKEVINFTNDCFAKNKVTMIISKGEVVVNIVASEPTSIFCKDSYLLTTSRHFKVKLAIMKGDHKVTFKGLNEDDMIEIAVNGIRIFGFCENISESVVSIYKTLKFLLESKSHKHDTIQKQIPFYKGKSQEQVELDHMNFLHKFANVKIEDRGKYGDMILPIEESIQSGDFIGLTEIDSLVSTLIMYMSGGRISHAAIALRKDNKLYVAEMKQAGLFLSPWKEFIDEQIFTHHYVVHCPLKEKYRKMFNTQKALEYYKSLGNMKYGNYNLLFPWFDDPQKATANYVPVENFLLFGTLVEKIDKSIIYKNLGAGLNMRLSTTNLTLSEMTIQAAKKNLTFEELFAIPEEDKWLYDNGENIICSSFVVAMYRHAGLFEGVDFNTKEIQPKDIYLLDFFDKDNKDKRPQICKDADPELPYCQVMGKYRLHLDGYSTISPYAHMFEKCPTLPPLYELYPRC